MHPLPVRDNPLVCLIRLLNGLCLYAANLHLGQSRKENIKYSLSIVVDMTKFIGLVSGKGGAGKTTVTLNLGSALNKLGKKVLLLDANLVTPNLALQLGLVNPEGTINKLLRKEKGIHEVIYLHESGIAIVPASPSYAEFQKTNPENLVEAFEHLENVAEVVLVDAPSGLGYDVKQVIKHCDEVILVVNPNLSSVMDALKTIQLSQAQGTTIAGVLLNLSHKGRHEMKEEEVEKILGYPLLANIRTDRKFRKSLHRQAPLVYLYPHSRSAKEFVKIAEHLSLEDI